MDNLSRHSTGFGTALLKLMVALAGSFALLVLAAQGVGSLQPLPEAMTDLYLTDCALPCWMGITPGQTTFDEALQTLKTTHPMNVFVRGSLIFADYQEHARFGRITLQAWDGVVNLIHLTPGENAELLLGDIAQRSGSPGCEIPSTRTSYVYTSPDAFATVLTQDAIQNRWRKPLINIEIRGASSLCDFY